MKYLFAIALAVTLSACATVGQGIDIASQRGAAAVSQAVSAQCLRSIDRRKQSYAVYAAEQKRLGGAGVMLPFDCDGDGKPDF